MDWRVVESAAPHGWQLANKRKAPMSMLVLKIALPFKAGSFREEIERSPVRDGRVCLGFPCNPGSTLPAESDRTSFSNFHGRVEGIHSGFRGG